MLVTATIAQVEYGMRTLAIVCSLASTSLDERKNKVSVSLIDSEATRCVPSSVQPPGPRCCFDRTSGAGTTFSGDSRQYLQTSDCLENNVIKLFIYLLFRILIQSSLHRTLSDVQASVCNRVK